MVSVGRREAVLRVSLTSNQLGAPCSDPHPKQNFEFELDEFE